MASEAYFTSSAASPFAHAACRSSRLSSRLRSRLSLSRLRPLPLPDRPCARSSSSRSGCGLRKAGGGGANGDGMSVSARARVHNASSPSPVDGGARGALPVDSIYIAGPCQSTPTTSSWLAGAGRCCRRRSRLGARAGGASNNAGNCLPLSHKSLCRLWRKTAVAVECNLPLGSDCPAGLLLLVS